ncbi:MAG: OmpH family outer membrane protein [Fimbriimonas sp.]|jgi:Skp family chaperone for outer membrane proteins|nr:OmpH family outer membrane protein [Fimbriimonas sp.]
MKREKLAWSGWIVAAGLAGIMLGSGFQTPSLKLGVVDLNAVIDKSDAGKSGKKSFEEMKAAREGLLEFIDQYRILTIEQANRLRELMLLKEKTKPEEAELERLKADIIATSKRSAELATKPNYTPEERTLVEEYSRRSQTMNETSTRWLREFSDEVQNWVASSREQNYQKAKAAAAEVAAKDGYTMVIEGSVAVFGANDITDLSLAAMNAKK